MPCAGFSPEIYDRYVLGLLEEPERSHLETQIEEQCPVCLRGVQRSMNLWLVFATTLEDAEPSADFRARLVRIAELSRKVLTFPRESDTREHPRMLTSILMAVCAVLVVMLFVTWYGGRQSVRLETQRAAANLDHLTQEVAATEAKLREETEKREKIEQKLTSTGRFAITQQSKLDQLLLQYQAEAEQYKAIIERDQQMLADNTTVLGALSNSAARLLPLKGSESAATSVAYALLVENSKLVFVGSKLPKPPQERQFQLWIVRKEEPKFVSAGVFSPDANRPVVLQFEQASLLSGVSLLEVTDEPRGGSSAPSGTKILEASTIAGTTEN